jgi:hypothetical protein
MKILVKCTLEVEVEVADNLYNEEFTPEFDIEENHCPGTGIVGSKIEEVMESCRKKSTCWACCFNGKNEILEIK